MSNIRMQQSLFQFTVFAIILNMSFSAFQYGYKLYIDANSFFVISNKSNIDWGHPFLVSVCLLLVLIINRFCSNILLKTLVLIPIAFAFVISLFYPLVWYFAKLQSEWLWEYKILIVMVIFSWVSFLTNLVLLVLQFVNVFMSKRKQLDFQ